MSEQKSVKYDRELILERFCGPEKYPVKKATWNLYLDEELGISNLCLSVEAGHGTGLHEDTSYLSAEPWWEINVVEAGLSSSSLVPGACFTVPSGYEESKAGFITNFYYCEHETTDNNTVEILAVEENNLLIRMIGYTIDVNYYDGSKPQTKIFLEGWFVHDSHTARSMQ